VFKHFAVSSIKDLSKNVEAQNIIEKSIKETHFYKQL